ncbi:MAG: hypothetical protein HGB36_08510 [Chlorobiaceae bacterium]|jgi:hypothetical protein|nr:hypothetical protein [Chlorobiaceae bacterium]
MKDDNKISDGLTRTTLSYVILIISSVAITILACYVIYIDNKEGKNVFNMVLPVFTSWVGTILAFYYGRDNIESANRQVRELVKKLTPEERSMTMVNAIMRSIDNMSFFQISSGKDAKDIKLTALKDKMDSNSRLPVVDSDKKPMYMIHNSSIDKYILSGGKFDDTLEQFINEQKKNGSEYGIDKGFVIVPEQSTIADAKRKMDAVSSCQDIFVTKKGNADEQLTGWISNIRMAKYLQV